MGSDQLDELPAGPAMIAHDAVSLALLERVALLQSRSARILRANGRHAEAARAERFAARARVALQDAQAVRRIDRLVGYLRGATGVESLLERALTGSMSLIGGELGNVQVLDAGVGGLRIAAHSGFDSDFLQHFSVVENDSSACGRAASRRAQTVIVDIEQDATFAPHREIAAGSRFRAVQSTPLLDRSGRLLGVISTHYRRPHRPSDRELALLAWYAEHVSAALANQNAAPGPSSEPSVALHERAADLHESVAARLRYSARALTDAGEIADGLESQERAWQAENRARQERERSRAAAARVQIQNEPHPRHR
jgi:GAF domain-containing protein